MSTVFLGQCLAETEGEGGSARLKRRWQSEVTGPRREEEATAAGRDSSLVTKAPGLRSKVFSLTLLAVLSLGYSNLNFVLLSQSVYSIEFIPKALKFT